MNKAELNFFLDEKVNQYENIDFIDSDPIQIPHFFSKKNDIEVSGFLTATIAWGKRGIIIKNAKKIMELMDNSPYDFVINHSKKDLNNFNSFVHRTFNSDDLKCFIRALKNIYLNHGGLELVLKIKDNSKNYKTSISNFKKTFFQVNHLPRTQKHISDPMRGSASKRINMFLRWMVRSSKKEVDFGLWKSHSSSFLHCPLDVHTGNIARKLNILNRKQNDWKAIEELDLILRTFDFSDPAKYDFALFGLGIFEKF